VIVAVAWLTWQLTNSNNDAPAAPLDVHYKRGEFPKSPGPLPNGGPLIACPPAPSNKPDSVAEAGDGVARAEYYRKNHLFLVYDEEGDGRSAILQVTVPGVSRTNWYNAKGQTCGGKRRPFVMVVDDIDPNQALEYQVCVGEWDKRSTVPPENCGDSVRIDPGDG
jgi:hypothetical protein